VQLHDFRRKLSFELRNAAPLVEPCGDDHISGGKCTSGGLDNVQMIAEMHREYKGAVPDRQPIPPNVILEVLNHLFSTRKRAGVLSRHPRAGKL
jgi:hypothetical protein